MTIVMNSIGYPLATSTNLEYNKLSELTVFSCPEYVNISDNNIIIQNSACKAVLTFACLDTWCMVGYLQCKSCRNPEFHEINIGTGTEIFSINSYWSGYQNSSAAPWHIYNSYIPHMVTLI